MNFPDATNVLRRRCLGIRKLFAPALISMLFAGFGVSKAWAQRPLGVDVSSYQGSSIVWTNVKNSGVSFAWAKATEGVSITDPDFTINAANAKVAGVLIGAYDFAHPEDNTPSAEATHFWSVAGGYIKNDGFSIQPVLDYETFDATNNIPVGATSYADWANQWCSNIVVKAAAAGLAVKPIIYTSTCEAGYLNGTDAQWTPWIANPSGQPAQTGSPWTGTTCNSSSYEIWGTGAWTVWQYSWTGTVPGISGTSNMDLDVFNGTSNQMAAALVIGSNSLPSVALTSQLNRVVDAGGSASFAATAAGTAPLNYQWLFNGKPIPGATTNFYNLVNAQTNNAGNYSLAVNNYSGGTTSSAVSLLVFPPQFTVFSDNFDSNTAANWIVNKSSSDNSVAFNFDYSTLGIPSAPHSANGTTRGVQMKANLSLGVVAALSISPTNQIFSGDYRLHFDAWINVNGPLPGGNGSTEYLTAGIGTSGTRTEWTGGGSTADGFYFSADGDGGVSASSTTTGDYAGYIGTAWQNAASGIYAAGSLDNLNSYYTAAFPTNQSAPALQQSNYPQQTGTLTSGTFGLAWHDVIVARRGSTVNWAVDGILFATITNASLTASNVFVGYWDPFASLSSNNAVNFGLVDNVRVEVNDPGYNQFLAAYDSGPGFNGGENLIFTNASGMNFYAWSSPYPSISVTNWLLEGPMSELPLGTSGQSRYGINVNPASSPEYYIFARTNTGLFTSTEALIWLTTSDFQNFTVAGSNSVISAAGIFAIPAPPAILTPPAATNVFAGRNAGFTVTATGSGTLNYHWLQAGVPLADGGNISGSQTNRLNFLPAATNQTGYYSVVVTNLLGGVTSSPVLLNVVALPSLYMTSSTNGLVVAADGDAAGDTYVIQLTTNLAPPIVWQPLQTNVIDASGQIRFVETNSTDPLHFYRLLIP